MLKRSLLIAKHLELVTKGKYLVAQRLYELLRKGYVSLDLGDVDDAASHILDSIDIPYNVNFRSGMARYHLARR